ncbi:MAG: TcfC E-set like domain-containing protein [Granulosicoccus sp.]|nr:TcfC E-set like domain-containing protein [Granulosicoccus sp.]
MIDKSTHLKSTRLNRIIRGHPSLALFISASLIGGARADQHEVSPVISSSTDPATISTHLQDRLLQTSSNLVLPASILDSHDSVLLRELLLTQGVELDLGARTGISQVLMQNLLTDLQEDNLLNRALDIELLLDKSADSTLSLHSSIIFPESSADRTDRKNGVSKEWQILWLDPAVPRRTSSTTYDRETEPEFKSGERVSSHWDVDIVLTRPATAEEIKLLAQQQAIEPISGSGLPGREPEQASSGTFSGSSTSDQIAEANPDSNKPESESILTSSVSPTAAPQSTAETSESGESETAGKKVDSPVPGTESALTEPDEKTAPSSGPTPSAPGAATPLVPGGTTAPGPGVTTAPEPGGTTAQEESGSSTASAPANTTSPVPGDVTPSLPGGGTNPPLPGGATPPLAGTTPPLAGGTTPPLAGGTTPPSAASSELPPDESRSSTEFVTDGIFSISDEVPPGFESLAGPQFLIVDVKYNGEIVGSVDITVTGDELTIDQPTELVALLPGVLEPERLIEELSYPLSTNANKICYGLDDPAGCGQLNVDVVGVIYDENNLLLEVFVAPTLQSVNSTLGTRYLPPPDNKNTSILSVYGVASDLPGEESSVDLSGRGLFGYGQGNVSTELDYNSRTDRHRLNQLKLQHHFADHELVAGSYAYQSGGALPDINLLGVGFASSLKTRVDLEHAFSTELVVYLARRSIVQLVVDDRVYYGESYPAGNQVIDTRLLPDGTYDVEIRIQDSQSGSRVENRRFTKSTQLPPRGETLFQVTAGTPLLFNDNYIFPETAGIGVAGLSFARRITDQSSYRLGLLQFGSNSFLQAGYIYLGEFISFQFDGSVGGDSTRAASARLGWYKDSLSLGMTVEQFSSETDVSENPAFEQFYSEDFRQLTFSVNRGFNNFSVGGRWNFRESDNEASGTTTTLEQYALYYRRPLFRRRGLRGLFDAALQQDEFGRRLSLQVKLFVDRNQWSTGLGVEVDRGEEGDTGYQAGIDTRWRSSDSERYQWEAGLYANSSDTGEMVGASLTLDHPWYQAGLSSDVNLNSSATQSTSSVAFFSAHLGADRRGFALGGTDFSQAGVIVDVQGQPAGSRFDIIVNDIKASTGQIGERQFIGLQPFESYEVRLRPQTVLSNGLDQETFEFTLFPGGVQRIELLAKQKVLLIATLVNQFGEVIENALIDYETNPILIEEGGFFQGEVTPGEKLLVKPSVGPECVFIVPEANGEEVLVMDEPILCLEAPAQ